MIRKKILVPVSFDSYSDAALDFAQVIAKSLDGMITCLHIIDESGKSAEKVLSEDNRKKNRREAEQKLAARVNSVISDKSVPFEIIVTEGRVHSKIIEKAYDLNATFIIMGRSDAQDLTINTVGSYTYYVITHSRVPVITLKNDKKNPYTNIILPLDLSKPIASKISKTIEVAQMLKADINVIAILNYDTVSKEVKYRAMLVNIQKDFYHSGIICNTKLLISRNSVSDEIIVNADKFNPGMILLMTQQEKDPTEYYIGSNARRIIQYSKLPIISIIPEINSKIPFSDPVLIRNNNPK